MSEGTLNGIPLGWCWVQVQDVAQAITGNTPPTSQPENYGGVIPFVKPPQLTDKRVSVTPETLSEQGAESARLLPIGAVLVSCIGNLGKTAIAGVACATNQQINALVFDGGMSSEYGWYYAQTLQPWLESVASATTVSIVNKRKFATAPFPLASLNEQIRIVEKLEELLSDLDAGVAELKAAQRKLAQYRQSVLKAAMEGKLTADWRAACTQTGEPQETGAELPQCSPTESLVRSENARLPNVTEQGNRPPKGIIDQFKVQAPPELATFPDQLEGWIWTNLGHVAAWGSGGTPSRSFSHFYTGNVPWFKTGELGPHVLMDSEEHISELALSSSSAKLFPPGSVALAMYGATIGRTSILGVSGATNQACAVGVPKAVSSEFLHLFLTSQELGFRQAGKGGAQPNISQGIVKSWPIWLPPPAEQAQIVSAASELLDCSEKFEQAIDSALRQSTAQRKNILKAAFAGQLVPQDPNDEPASVLLERLRAVGSDEGRTVSRKRGRKIKESV